MVGITPRSSLTFPDDVARSCPYEASHYSIYYTACTLHSISVILYNCLYHFGILSEKVTKLCSSYNKDIIICLQGEFHVLLYALPGRAIIWVT